MVNLKMSVAELREVSRKIRVDIIEMLAEAGSGHPGGSLSSADILACLYFSVMKHDPGRPQWPERDYFILSKGHVCPALYAALAEAGYFSRGELATLRQCGSRLQGHPGRNKDLPGIEVSSGSLGQGLSIGVGIALGLRMDAKSNRVYVLMGDGEQDEGQVWEAYMSAAHYKLDNLCAIVDNNNLQIDGRLEDVMDVYPLEDKYRAFNWHAITCDGHDYQSLLDAFEEAASTKGKPTVIVAKTVKGKGVSFMEDVAGWHGKAPNADEAKQAIAELEQTP
jgi:transketolase